MKHNPAKNILIVSDNAFLINAFYAITKGRVEIEVSYRCSPSNLALLTNKTLPVPVTALKVKDNTEEIIKNFDLVISLHCKQLFPAEVVKVVRCINVHPGYNPYNRGWFPQVFSILNKKKAGATIHEIDEQLDHGRIIARREITIMNWETSFDVYNRVQEIEVELLRENIDAIINGVYETIAPEEEGNINLKQDFNKLCQIDMEKKVTMGEAIDYLRATTHGEYMNAWYIDPTDGKKIYVKLELRKER